MIQPVVIIGSGVAGLACAQRLHQVGIAFTLVSKDIGGRILESPNHQVNYGAYYVTADYTHVKNLVRLTRRISPLYFEFHHQAHTYPLLSWRLLHLFPQYWRFRRLLREFRTHLLALRRQSERVEQAQLIEHDPYLRTLFYQPAEQFVKTHRLQDWFEEFMEEPLYATGFVGVHEMQAFDLLWLSQPLIVPTYQYTFSAETTVAPFRDAVVSAEVTQLEQNARGWVVHLNTGAVLHGAAVVVAVPTSDMQRLLHTNEGRGAVNAYMFHIQGKLRTEWAKHRYNVFETKSDIITITSESDGSHLVYARTPNITLANYFITYQVIAQKSWEPAFHVLGTSLVKQVRGNNLFVAGEHNICNLEDSYLTGLFAANQIIAQHS